MVGEAQTSNKHVFYRFMIWCNAAIWCYAIKRELLVVWADTGIKK